MRPSTRLRFVYFGLAALWGFVLGVGALAAAVSAAGDLKLGPAAFGVLLPAGFLAVLGGVVAAAAYREARRKLR